MRPGSEWIPCLLQDLEKKKVDTREIACYHRILKLEGVNDNPNKADQIFKAAERTVETIILPLAHPRFHPDEDFLSIPASYTNLLADDPRTIVVYDMLTIPEDGQFGRNPVNVKAMDRLIDFWRILSKDRVMERSALITHLAEVTQLAPC